MVKNKLDAILENIKKDNKKAFVPYVLAGYPTLDKLVDIVLCLEKNGATAIEIGIPNSDPLGDGEVISKAALNVISRGISMEDILNELKSVREKTDIPLLIMTYFNNVYSFGISRLVAELDKIGIEGVIIPDLPYEEKEEVDVFLREKNMHFINMITLTSKGRIEKIASDAKGFLYCVSSLGITGVRNEFDDSIKGVVRDIRKYTDIPLLIGFGISSKEDIERFNELADGTIMGSAIIKKLKDCNEKLRELNEFLQGLELE